MKKWYESQPGRVSAMRIMAVPGLFISLALAALSTVGSLFWEANIANLVAWLGFAGICIGGKNLQKKKESNENQ
jgi:hypothetical protein